MSVLKDLLQVRFWVSVAVVLLTVAVVTACGAATIVWGIAPMDTMGTVGVVAWMLGGFVGARMFAKGKEGVLIPALLVVLVAFGAVCLMGLFPEGNAELAGNWLRFGAAVMVGGVLAALIRPKKKRRVKMSGKGRGKSDKRR